MLDDTAYARYWDPKIRRLEVLIGLCSLALAIVVLMLQVELLAGLDKLQLIADRVGMLVVK